ncbi:MAG: IclR family transcriptional regulator C-terminal domain-containing protein [Rubrimonas sp.]
MIELGRDLRETVNVARVDGSDIVYIQRIPTHRTTYIATLIGRRLPALNTSAGRIALACAPIAQIESACASWPVGRFTDRTEQDRGLIRDSVIAAKSLGYAITEEQLMRNEIGLAAAVRDAGGAAVGAIQVSVSNLRWSQARARAELAPAVVEVAAAVSAPLTPAP